MLFDQLEVLIIKTNVEPKSKIINSLSVLILMICVCVIIVQLYAVHYELSEVHIGYISEMTSEKAERISNVNLKAAIGPFVIYLLLFILGCIPILAELIRHKLYNNILAWVSVLFPICGMIYSVYAFNLTFYDFG